jgi:deoxyribodipyrimidine photo-lyase
MKAPNAADVAGRHVWLVHPWNLGDLPTTLSQDTVVVGVFVNDFHQAFPWSEGRWNFVASRMAELASVIWHGDAATIEAGLKSAHSVQSTDDLHVRPWLSRWAQCEPAPTLFPAVDRRCDSFSQWWTRATRGIKSASELLVDNRATQRLFF